MASTGCDSPGSAPLSTDGSLVEPQESGPTAHKPVVSHKNEDGRRPIKLHPVLLLHHIPCRDQRGGGLWVKAVGVGAIIKATNLQPLAQTGEGRFRDGAEQTEFTGVHGAQHRGASL